MDSDGPLSGEEVTIIQSTWSLVQADLKGNGAKLFIHFFTGFPEYQQRFRGFADIPLANLATNRRLIAHGYTVMSAIGGLVDNLDDPELLTELLHNTGQNHIKRKLKIGDFQNLQESLIEFLGKAFGEAWTPEAEIAWTKVLQLIFAKIGEGLNTPPNS